MKVNKLEITTFMHLSLHFWNVLMIKIIQCNRAKDIINVYVVY